MYICVVSGFNALHSTAVASHVYSRGAHFLSFSLSSSLSSALSSSYSSSFSSCLSPCHTNSLSSFLVPWLVLHACACGAMQGGPHQLCQTKIATLLTVMENRVRIIFFVIFLVVFLTTLSYVFHSRPPGLVYTLV